jgi:hypothetical protein
VLRQPLVPALLLMVPATAALSASATIVQAAEECRVTPGPAAPAGSRWYFRVDRAEHRRCWFLRSRDVGVHSRLIHARLTRGRHFAGDITAAVQEDQQGAVEQQIAFAQTDHSAQTGHTDIALPVEQTTLPQAAASLVEPSPEYLIPRSVPTVTYRRSPRGPKTASGPTVSAARSQTPVAAGNSTIVLLAVAAATGLLLAGGVFHLTHRVHRRSREQAIADRRGVREAVVIRSSVAAKLPPVTTDPADDLNRSRRELRRDPRRASEAYNLPLSLRKHASSCATSLPHAGAWLSRPQAKPTTKPANCHGVEAKLTTA